MLKVDVVVRCGVNVIVWLRLFCGLWLVCGLDVYGCGAMVVCLRSVDLLLVYAGGWRMLGFSW